MVKAMLVSFVMLTFLSGCFESPKVVPESREELSAPGRAKTPKKGEAQEEEESWSIIVDLQNKLKEAKKSVPKTQPTAERGNRMPASMSAEQKMQVMQQNRGKSFKTLNELEDNRVSGFYLDPNNVFKCEPAPGKVGYRCIRSWSPDKSQETKKMFMCDEFYSEDGTPQTAVCTRLRAG